MSAYTAKLHQESQRRNTLVALDRAKRKKDLQQRLAPLDERLARLLTTIPDEMIRDGIQLKSLQERLKGRKGSTCHPGDLGRALARLGFKRKRKWVNGEPTPTIWQRH